MKGARGPTDGRRAGAPDTRELILDCAEELLLRRGYGGFAYQHIAVQLGLRHAAIHYHFPTKPDLGTALVQRYRARFAAWAETMAAVPDAWSRLRAWFARYAEHVAAEGCPLCPVGALAAEAAGLPDPMRLQTRLLLRDTRDWLAQTLAQAREEGSVRFAGEPQDKAAALGAALQGGLQVARLEGGASFSRLSDQLLLELRPLPR